MKTKFWFKRITLIDIADVECMINEGIEIEIVIDNDEHGLQLLEDIYHLRYIIKSAYRTNDIKINQLVDYLSVMVLMEMDILKKINKEIKRNLLWFENYFNT